MGALADDAASTPVSEQAQVSPATQQGGGSAAYLGPPSSVSSAADGGVLQPYSNNPLQAGGNAASNGLVSPDNSQLQGSAPSGDLKVVLGNEADGGIHAPNTAPVDNSPLDTLALLAVIGFIGLIWVLRRRVAQRFSS